MNREGDSPDYEELYSKIYSLSNEINHLETANAKLVEENEIESNYNDMLIKELDQLKSELSSLKDENEGLIRPLCDSSTERAKNQILFLVNKGLDYNSESEERLKYIFDMLLAQHKLKIKAITEVNKSLQSELSASKERVKELEEASAKLLEWNKKYPPNKIYDWGMGKQIELKLTEIIEIHINLLTPKQHG